MGVCHRRGKRRRGVLRGVLERVWVRRVPCTPWWLPRTRRRTTRPSTAWRASLRCPTCCRPCGRQGRERSPQQAGHAPKRLRRACMPGVHPADAGAGAGAEEHHRQRHLPGLRADRPGQEPNRRHRQVRIRRPEASSSKRSPHVGQQSATCLCARPCGVTGSQVGPGARVTNVAPASRLRACRVRGIPREKVISDVLLADQPTKKVSRPSPLLFAACVCCWCLAGPAHRLAACACTAYARSS